MSNTTANIEAVYTELQAKLKAIPEVSKKTAYAQLLHRLLCETQTALEASQDMDYDKSMSRI